VGQRATPDEIRKKIEGWFPRLDTSTYVVASKYDPSYNCAAFAVNDCERWWEPLNPDGYWPANVPLEFSVAAYAAAFETVDFHKCDTPTVEDGFEKLAIYSDEGDFVHAARQNADGSWVSKLGKAEDIRHRTLEELTGHSKDEYGDVVVFMKRRRA
jgi:hypothetical protein